MCLAGWCPEDGAGKRCLRSPGVRKRRGFSTVAHGAAA